MDGKPNDTASAWFWRTWGGLVLVAVLPATVFSVWAAAEAGWSYAVIFAVAVAAIATVVRIPIDDEGRIIEWGAARADRLFIAFGTSCDDARHDSRPAPRQEPLPLKFALSATA